MTGEKKLPRGFAAMAQTPEGRKALQEIASKGGKAAHAAGTAHQFTKEEAEIAGRKGGTATHAKRRAQKDTLPPTGHNVDTVRAMPSASTYDPDLYPSRAESEEE